MKQKSVILNLNGSIDDCILLFKAIFTKSIKIEAVVVSAGACSMDIATRNIRHILEKYNVELPVVEGETTLYDGKTIEVTNDITEEYLKDSSSSSKIIKGEREIFGGLMIGAAVKSAAAQAGKKVKW